jgi:chromosome segregation ATPase
MTTNLIPWIFAGLCAIAALALWVRLRSATLEAGSRGQEAEQYRGELSAARNQLEKTAAKQRRHSDELAEMRKRLDKAKKRAASAGAAGRGNAPVANLELETALEQVRQARDAALEEAKGLSQELSRLRAASAEPGPTAEAMGRSGTAGERRTGEGDGR